MVTEMTPEIGFDISRSPSAPATVSGDFSGAGDIFSGDPDYLKYYYSNVNSNPRLSPPLLSKSSCGGIGDKRKLNRGNELTNGYNNCDHLLFSKELGFDGYKEGNGWSGLGLPGLGLGNRQKSIAEIIQEDLNHSKSMSKIPSRPVSCNAFDENIADSEGQCDPRSSSDAVCTGGKVQGNSSTNNVGVSASFSYASALGASLSRSTTADSQFLARGPSPCLPVVGESRVNSVDKRSVNSPTSLNGTLNEPRASADLAAALSGLNLSEDLQMDDEKQIRQQFQHGIDNHLNGNNLLGNDNYVKQTSQLDATEFWPFPQQSVSCSAKGSYVTMGKGCEIKVDLLVEHKKQGGANSPTNFYSVDSPGSVIPNYGLSGHSVDPALASVMAGQFGHGALPPLFESAAASTIGIGGMDSRKLGGRISSQANLMDAASELKSFGRIGSHTASDGLQSSQVDPLHLHYLTSTNYTATQLAALSDPSIDEANSYMDLLALQKAYLGTLLSPSESECGRPYLGKSAGLNHGYYSNPAFGIGSAYSGNPLLSSLLTHSPMGSGSLLRHGERNMRLPSAMRNIAAGFMGNRRSEASGFMDQSFGSSLLDEFKSNKTKCFELSEIAGHVVEFSADQYGSRFIQQKLETASTEEKNMVFREIIPQALSLMTDVFGNYVIQKFFEHGTAPQIKELADKLTGHVLTLSLQMYGCRVIQKAIEVVDLDQQKKMVVELDGNVMRCVRDQNGNHVIQKCIECVPEDAIHFIISTFYDQVVTLSSHPYGCRVIQRVLEHCHDIKTQHIVMDEIMHSVCMLAQDQYGNYVVQHVMEHGKPHERSAIISELNGKIVQMSQQKFASNVIEKCLAFGDATERRMMVNEMLRSTDENEPLQVMMKDQFANYVVQKVMETCDDQQLEVILSRIKNHLNALKKYTYGKHIVARVEKLVAAGERRISLQCPYPATMA